MKTLRISILEEAEEKKQQKLILLENERKIYNQKIKKANKLDCSYFIHNDDFGQPCSYHNPDCIKCEI